VGGALGGRQPVLQLRRASTPPHSEVVKQSCDRVRPTPSAAATQRAATRPSRLSHPHTHSSPTQRTTSPIQHTNLPTQPPNHTHARGRPATNQPFTIHPPMHTYRRPTHPSAPIHQGCRPVPQPASQPASQLTPSQPVAHSPTTHPLTQRVSRNPAASEPSEGETQKESGRLVITIRRVVGEPCAFVRSPPAGRVRACWRVRNHSTHASQTRKSSILSRTNIRTCYLRYRML
jgi:hypothetical protein